ncbi:putative 8-amino-7-oxononanoate synthase [Lyngbya aestuarii BL J]|uniref:Putative 8-amino-7-oxononanoate synthase n=1 Tax=Lyngbya aestuarii BL J TaxID=1348334 RepID=U7QEN4_9CYAN|nr:hypothetical protein [Lyngbya aestuarii]ERT05540.1 putative 8-amino-7-oxononanoate synthase [Lyngbya aestuarii BL J]
MGIERRLFRGMFDAGEVVELRQTCFTPSRVYQPGKYIAGELPDIAFDMGLVEKLPPVRGNSAEIRDPEQIDLDSESE